MSIIQKDKRKSMNEVADLEMLLNTLSLEKAYFVFKGHQELVRQLY